MSERFKHIFYEVIIFSMIYYLGFKMFSDEYLFGWLVHNLNFFLALAAIAIILLIFKQTIISHFMTAGITIGVFVGNFLGKWLREINIAKINPNSSAQEVAKLHLNHGFSIMIFVIIVSIILGVYFQIKENKKIQ